MNISAGDMINLVVLLLGLAATVGVVKSKVDKLYKIVTNGLQEKVTRIDERVTSMHDKQRELEADIGRAIERRETHETRIALIEQRVASHDH